jgi:hypothetical protein
MAGKMQPRLMFVFGQVLRDTTIMSTIGIAIKMSEVPNAAEKRRRTGRLDYDTWDAAWRR